MPISTGKTADGNTDRRPGKCCPTPHSARPTGQASARWQPVRNLLDVATSTGVTAMWWYSALPLASVDCEQHGQKIFGEEKKSVPSSTIRKVSCKRTKSVQQAMTVQIVADLGHDRKQRQRRHRISGQRHRAPTGMGQQRECEFLLNDRLFRLSKS